ncbi:MAG: pyruvate kinase [Candidatus Moranbacteria bacterium]|nr:pyruvate kinase [Candidatus Moranbacteria bacterium]NTW46002.1 pyruvate kinase [Candidatus Moranbacteria bacterium]
MKNTKIVATIGPASESKDTLRELVRAGMNVVRLNFSHNEHAWHKAVIGRVRELSEELSTPIGILADLQGPRIRVGNETEIPVAAGQSVRISDTAHMEALADSKEATIVLDVAGISDSLEAGHEVLIQDGTIRLVVTGRDGGFATAEAKNDAVIRPRKGVNLPDSAFDLPVLSEKDLRDLAFVLGEGVEYVGLSFVGSAKDIDRARETMKEMLPEGVALPEIVSKIERREAIRNLDEVIGATDAVMVARGDLGIEMPEAEVTLLQKDIVRRSLMALKPVIVATQMMKSMVEEPIPTRAEVSDVTNAVVDHADAVMLSEESAMGKYPVETVAMMREIITKTEESPFDDVYDALDLNVHSEYAMLIRSVYELAKSFRTKAILLLSMSGYTAKLASHFRPDTGILVATNDRTTYNRLALLWGARPYLFEGDRNLDSFIDKMVDRAKEDGGLAAGDQAVVFLGRVPGERDMMRLVGIREIR